MSKSCQVCGVSIRLGSLCANHAEQLATADDFTAEQIIDPVSVEPAATLVDQWGMPHPICNAMFVGRTATDATLGLLHHTVSAVHAQFFGGSDGWQIIDRGSLNGTFVDGHRGRQSVITDGAHLRFGDISLYFQASVGTHADVQLGPGRTVPAKSDELAFSARLQRDGKQLELLERPGGGIAKSGRSERDGETTLEFARLEFALLVILAEQRQRAASPELAYVSSRELANRLAFRSQDADTDNVRELIRRVRNKFRTDGIDDLIESRQGVGYRLAWPLNS